MAIIRGTSFMNTSMQHKEAGAALIIVLGLVAIISGWAATAAYEDMLSMRRASNQLVSIKAELASLSGLALLKEALRQDLKDGTTDSLDDVWAQATPPFPVDDGLVSGEVVDMNRYMNVNALIDENGKVIVPMVQAMKRLFTRLELNSDLVDALVDWLDSDTVPYGVGGAEDSSYYGKDYKIKNAALDRWDELRLIAGFDQKIIGKLRGLLVVWPQSQGANKININTVEDEVLLAMFPNIVNISDIRDQRPYKQVRELQASTWAQGEQAQKMFSRLSVVSDGFMVRTHAVFGRADWQEEYGLLRQGQKVTLLWRERLFRGVEDSSPLKGAP